jgi:photosystem II stability/assembly factor-like uncharacterized protein
MTSVLILGTRQGVITATKQGSSWVESSRSLSGRRVTGVTTTNRGVLAGTTEGIYRSSLDLSFESDLEAPLISLEWEPVRQGIEKAHIRYLSTYPGGDDRVLAGTEPAEIYISTDGGDTWRDCPEVAAMREKYDWRLPYSPEAGCVRGFAFHGSRAYAAVEDGCVLISNNSGETWRLAEGSSGGSDHSPPMGSVHSDVHSIEAHPSSGDLVLAPTGGGLFLSKDGGASWDNLYRCYTRAAWQDPQDPDHTIFGPATAVDRGGRIEESKDGGKTWVDSSQGLDTPWKEHMVERFLQVGEDLLVVLSNGELATANLRNLQWEMILPGIPFVLSAAGFEMREK